VFTLASGNAAPKVTHSYRNNGAGTKATMQTPELYTQQLLALQSIRTGMKTVMHDITAILAIEMLKLKTELLVRI
jgi:hypothetical protein